MKLVVCSFVEVKVGGFDWTEIGSVGFQESG
jgi:hypothetical protein